jgi:hypothetical protein
VHTAPSHAAADGLHPAGVHLSQLLYLDHRRAGVHGPDRSRLHDAPPSSTDAPWRSVMVRRRGHIRRAALVIAMTDPIERM